MKKPSTAPKPRTIKFHEYKVSLAIVIYSMASNQEREDSGLFTLVPKVLRQRFLIRWLYNFEYFY